MKARFLAIDLGAESGRGMVGTFDGGRLVLDEVHRFPHRPSLMGNTLYWDLPCLFEETKMAMMKSREKYGENMDGLGVDSWGVDFGIVDSGGELSGFPVHYRDRRTEGVLGRALEIMPAGELFRLTGIQIMPINTLFQLLVAKDRIPRGGKILLVADLMNHLLTGRIACEFTLATTTQMLSPWSRSWCNDVMDAFGIDPSIVPEIVFPGDFLGHPKDSILRETGLARCAVTAVASHDTASAAAAAPAERGTRWAYLSSGTWSLLGVEAEAPLTGELARSLEFTGEGAAGGGFNLQKNMQGLWLLQQCRKKWDLGYDEIVSLAERARPFGPIVDIDDPCFSNPPDMEGAIVSYCRDRGLEIDTTPGGVARVIYESMAMKYRIVLGQLAELTGSAVDVLHVIGGGSRNDLLCRLTADAAGIPVIAGPAEATAAGNVLVQALSAGAVSSLQEGRDVIRRSFTLRRYEPGDTARWDDAFITSVFNTAR